MRRATCKATVIVNFHSSLMYRSIREENVISFTRDDAVNVRDNAVNDLVGAVLPC
jgi:hypothetical protein